MKARVSFWLNVIVVLSLTLTAWPAGVRAKTLAVEPESVPAVASTSAGHAATPTVALPVSAVGQDDPLAKVEPLVLDELAAASQTDFFVWMTEKADLSPAYRLETKEEKGRFVFETLRETAERSQKALRAYLEQQGMDYRPFYIVNKILVRGGNQTLLLNIASRPDVTRITANHRFQLQEPFINPSPPPHILAVETNISFVNADAVWAMGYTGAGTVLAGNDTGLDWDHPALINQYRGWDGATADHNYNWWDASGIYPTIPNDGYGHGTHTSGTMVGDDGGANQIGMAPGAQTIHCKNMDDFGGGLQSWFTECFEWDLAPWDLTYTGPGTGNPRPDLAPDAINNSWGWPGGLTVWEDEIAALQAAGILVEVSAGNSGPSCGTLGSPGDYRQSLTTGSVNHAGGSLPGTLTGFSSRGPSSLYPTDYIPDVMAPGENIRSSVPGGGYQGGWSGTSMSGPHVTGLIGLMWSANPGLRGMVTETVNIILDTAVPLTGQTGSNCGGDYTDGPNNDWGYGTIDALAAVEQAILYGGTGTLEGTVTDGALAAVPDATIRATLNPTLSWQTASDALGDYSMIVFSGTYTIDAYKYGHIPARITGVSIVSGTTTTQNITLPPAAYYVVSGYVTDSVTGDPLWATVNVAGDPVDPPTTTVQTDPATGYYSLTLAGGITYTFDVAAPLHNNTIRTVGPLTGDTTENFALMATTTDGIIAGWVRNKYTGDPIRNATVEVEGGPSATTDAGGYYQTTAMSPGFYTATASANLYSSVTITDIEVVQSNIGWANFDLPTPRIEVEPTVLSYTLQLGDQITQTPGLVISNTGEGGLDFELWEKKGGFQPTLLATGPFADAVPLVPPEYQEAATTEGLDLPPAPVGTILAAGDVIQSWPSGLAAAWGIAYSSDDKVWVGLGWDPTNTIYEYLPDGTPTGVSHPYTWGPIYGPADSAFNWNAGMVWTLDVGGDDCIHEMDPTTGYTGNTICGPWSTSQRGVAYDPETDTWYVGGWNEGIIYHIDSSGALLDSANVGLSISGLAYNPETQHLFVQINGGTNDVYVLDASLPGVYPQIGQFHIGPLASGAGLEIDCEGNLWAVDQSNEMIYQAESGESASLCAQDAVPWFAEAPITGTVAPSDSLDIDIGWWANVPQVDQPGAYHAGLKIKSNDPANQNLVLPVTMTVTAPATWGKLAGVVSSTGHCDVNPHPIVEAQVYLEGSGGYTFTLETNTAGAYQRWLDSTESPYTVTVSYPEHPTTTASVTIIAGVTTTQDFTLRWQQPCISVTPAGISATLNMGLSTTLPMSISNSGAVTATFALLETDRGFEIATLSAVQIPGYQAPEAETWRATSTYAGRHLVSRDSWSYQPSTDAFISSIPADVLLVAAADATQIQAMLQAYPDINLVDYFDARVATPTLAQLLDYDTVIVMSDFTFADPVAVGDVLADYVDAGGTVVQTVPTFYDPGGNGWGLQGRFVDEGYSPFIGTGDWFLWADLGPFDPSHPIMQGVTAAGDDLRQMMDLNAGTDLVAEWTDDEFVATKGSVVALNTFLPDGYSWTGDVDLIVHNSIIWLQAGGDAPWLFENPITGTVSADGGLASISVTLDAAQVAQPGEYHATLNVNSNDPNNSRIGIPVTMTVNLPSTYGKLQGAVTSLGYCDVNTTTLEGAEVLIEGHPLTLTTDISGTYVLWLDQGTYTVTASYAEHLAVTTVVTITAQATTTHDVALRWQQPCISVTPAGISATLNMGLSTTLPMSISNSGATALEFEIIEQEGGFTPLWAIVAFNAEAASLATGTNNSGQLVTSWVSASYPQAIGDFTSKAPSPVPLTCVTVDPNTGYIYAQEDRGYGFYRYDPYSDSWTALSSCPIHSGNNGGTAYLNGKIYTAYTGNSSQIGVYDIAADSWSTISNGLGQGTGNITADEQYIYLAYGTAFQRYDPASDTWSSLASPGISFDRWGGLSHLNGTIYGHQGNGGTSFAKYDIASDTWTTLSSVPGGAVLGSAIDPASQVYYAYGSYGGSNWYAFDLTSETWSVSTIPLFSVMDGGMAHVSGSGVSGIYFVQGESGTGFGRFETAPYSPDVPWLFEDPITGTVPAYSVMSATITFDASQVNQPGIYQANLRVSSNDPYSPTVDVPVTMTVPVNPDMGKITGTVTSDRPGGPLEGALVEVISGTTTVISGTTDTSGGYGPWWLTNGAYSVTVSAMGYFPDEQTVTITAGVTTTHDVVLLSSYVLGAVAYVTLSDSNLVALVDTASHMVMGTVNVGAVGCYFPWRATMSPDGDYVYVGCRDSGNVAVIETAGSTVVTTVGGIPSADGIAFTRDGVYALVGSMRNNQIAVVDTTAYVVTRTIPTPNVPRSVAVHPHLDRAYATCRNGTIQVIDLTTFSIITAIPVGGDPRDAAVSPDGRWVFVSDRSGAGLAVIAAGSNTVHTTVTGLGGLQGLAVMPDGSRVYAADRSGDVRVIDGATFNYLTSIPGTGSGWDVAVTCDGSELYVTRGRSGNQVPVVDTATSTVTDTINLPGSGPRGIAVCPQFRLPGLYLYPAAQSGYDTPGRSVVYEKYLANATGQTDSFDLSLSNIWDTSLSLANTGPLSDGAWISFTVQVTIPVWASPGDADAAAIQATSVTSPTVYTDTATITTTAMCSPTLVFGGQSAQTMGDLDDVYDYGGQKFTYVYVYGYSGDNDTLDATVSGYDPGSGTWQIIAQQVNGGSGVIADQYLIPATYTQARVQLDDREGNDLIYYDYRFIVCRSPAVALNPPSQQSFAQPGTTAVYTQTVTNYVMATDSFDLSASGNSWPTTFWDGATQINNTGSLADQETFTFTVKVDVPPGVSGGNVDAATLQVVSVASPAISDTGSLRTTVLAYPWVQAFSDYWAPNGSTDRDQYLDIVRSSGIVTAQVTDDWDSQNGPPAVAAYPREAIVAAWAGPYRWNGAANYYNIEYAAFDADGNTVISVTQVSDNISATVYTRDYNPAPAVAPTDGNALIAWYRYENGPYNIYYAVRGPAGSEILSPTALTTNTTSTVRDYYPSAAAFDDGRFAVAWRHYDSSTGASDIYYAVMNSDGSLLAGPVNLTNNAWEDDYEPRANRLADGNVLLTWYGYHGSGYEIYYAVLDSAGNVVYPITRLTDTPYNAYYPDAVGLRNGNTIVSWEQYGYYPNYGRQIAYAVLDSAYTTTVATQILTNTLENWNYYVSLARDGDDNAVLTWRDDDRQHIYYAVVDYTGAVRTWPLVFRTARGSELDISRWGAGNGSLPGPLLTLDKTAAPDPVVAGGTLVYTLTYSNAGSSPTSGIVLTETYDANVTFIAADPPPDVGDNVWNIVTLPNGMTGTIVITVQVASPLPDGTLLHNQATLDAPDTDAAVASADTSVTSAPVWTLTKSDSADPVAVGGLLVYTIAYDNSGNEDATGVVITETYDTNVTFVSADPAPTSGDNVWDIGPVNAGLSDSIVVTVKVGSPLPDGTLLTNRVLLDSDQSGPVEHIITTTATSAPVWTLTKSDSPDPVAEGSTLVYTVIYGNVGNENATGVSVVETYPPQVTFVAADPPPSLGNTVWNVGPLDAGVTGTIVITVEVDAPLPNDTVLTNTVTIAGNEAPPLSVDETTLVQAPTPAPEWIIYLPLVMRNR